ncbi:related to methyltransferase [Rhynchosporium secalis]|uniref:Related to methyltransferase n=1 Tax=Rhynchosporium secalis TaxID=38038 RepID=A0A1E1MBU0_RHYSE|nr:related to methyltransferase [Rhynchosporium secalis]
MVPMNRGQGRVTASDHSSDHYSPTREAEEPLLLDDIEIDGDMDAHGDESLEDVCHFRSRGGARTLYHQPLSESDTLNSTQSLYDTDVEYVTLHDRRYCENYNMPNDDAEQGRMQLLNSVLLDILDGHLTLAPLRNPTKILDIGTGTGDWTIAMAEMYPNTNCIGTDIAKIQPTSVPSNVNFEIDDAEYEGGWTWPEDTFNLVHLRNMAGAFRDWSHIYREAFRTIKPGGYIEVIDSDVSQLSTLFLHDPRACRWFKTVSEAAKKAGRHISTDHLETSVLAAAGFTDISVTTKKIPLGSWPSDSKESKTSAHFHRVLRDGIEAISLRLFTEQLEMQPEAVRALCKDVSRSLRALIQDPQKSKGLSMDVQVLVARKPGGGELELPEDENAMGNSMRTVPNDYSKGETVPLR